MAKTLPEDIIHQILLCLPVKSLVRFTCVSKSRAALIYSSSFAKSHLQHSTITKSVMDILFVHKGYSIKFSQLSVENSGADGTDVEEIKYPFSPDPSGMNFFHEDIKFPLSPDPLRTGSFHFAGSCNGLLYFVNKSFSKGFVLFNPLTKNYCKIPNITQLEGRHSPKCFENDDILRLPIGTSSFANWFWGCVYDQVSDGYKVIAIKVEQHFWERVLETSGWIYSPKSGSWRRIADMSNYNIAAPTWGAYVSNALHWVIYDGPSFAHRPRYVAVLDMGTEKFRLLPLPDYLWNHESFTSFNLEVLDECLCFCYYSNRDDYRTFEIWMMREYGTENGCKWDRLIKFRFDNEYAFLTAETMKPLALSKNGKLLLVYVREEHGVLHGSTHTLAWYDIDTGSRKSEFNFPNSLGQPHVYIPSLINPNPATCDFDK